MPPKAIYPGSFDPITYGHLDLIRRSAKIFSGIVIAVAKSSPKGPLFTTQERVDMIKAVTKDIPNVTIKTFDGLVINFARQNNIRVLIRGMRMISDFEYELQMASTNRRLDDNIETVFLMPSEGFSFLSSTLIKEAAALGADLKSFVPDYVANKLRKKLKLKK